MYKFLYKIWTLSIFKNYSLKSRSNPFPFLLHPPSLSLFPSLSSHLSTYIIRQLYNKPNYQCTHVLIDSFLTLELPEVINM